MPALITPEKIATSIPNLKLYSATVAFLTFVGKFLFLADSGPADEHDAEQRNEHAGQRCQTGVIQAARAIVDQRVELALDQRRDQGARAPNTVRSRSPARARRPGSGSSVPRSSRRRPTSRRTESSSRAPCRAPV